MNKNLNPQKWYFFLNDIGMISEDDYAYLQDILHMSEFNFVYHLKEIHNEFLKAEFLKKRSTDNVLHYLRKFSSEEKFREIEAQHQLISGNDHERIMASIKRNHFADDFLFFELLKRNNDEEILTYVKNWHLNPASQLLLLERNKHQEIMAYIKGGGYFEGYAQAIFLTCGEHEAIMCYLDRHYISAKENSFGLLLLARGNAEELSFFFEKNYFVGPIKDSEASE